MENAYTLGRMESWKKHHKAMILGGWQPSKIRKGYRAKEIHLPWQSVAKDYFLDGLAAI